MLKLNCLLKNTPAAAHIKDAIEMMVSDFLEANDKAPFSDVYNSIRKAGIEVDAESIGEIYNGLYGEIEDERLSTIEEVEEFTGKNFQKQIDSLVDDILGETELPATQELGFDSPEKYAVNKISKLFQNEIFGKATRNSTVLKQMQDFTTKAAASLLDKKTVAPVGLTSALDSFFNLESNQFKTLSGQANTLKTLHEAIQKEVYNYVDQAALKLSDEEADILREQWETYTDAIINSTYDIVLNKGNQNSLVNQSLQQIEIEGVNIVDLNGNVKWDALIEYDNPDTISQKVKELFKEGFTDKNGVVTKYSNEQAERIGDYFQRMYEKKLASAKERTIGNNRVRNMSAKNIISDFIKDRGFFNLVKDKNGNLLLTQADWDNAIKTIKKLIGTTEKGKIGDKEIRGLDLVQQKLKTWLNSQTKEDGTPKFTDSQKRLIEDEFVKTALAKLVPATAEPTSLERLIALDKLNSSKAFNNETQQALNKVVGVNGLNQAVLDKIQALSKLANSILSGNIVTGSTNANPDVNRAAYAYTALTEIDRKIKEILRQHKVDNSSQQKIVKYLSDLMGGGTVSLLLNINNALENINTQLFTNIGETVSMAVTNPKLFAKTFGGLQGEFWGQWLNYAQGGASNEIANESDISADIQSSERLRVRALINEVKEKGVLKGLGSIALKSPQYVVSILSRVLMNSFDAATTTSLMRKRMIQSTYSSLIALGNSPQDVMNLMDQALKIKPTIEAQIKAENARIEGLLRAAGFPVNKSMMAQNERDMRLSAYEDVIRDAGKNVGASLKQSTEITKALIDASQKGAKTLGGKRQLPTKDILSVAIYKTAEAIIAPQKSLFAASRIAEEKGELGKAARLQFAASAYQNSIGKFVGGVANFMNLAITATPLGFMQGGILMRQRNQYANDHAGAADIFNADPQDIKRYAELHATMRSVFTRAIMGSTILAAFIAKSLAKGDEDDEEGEDWFKNLMSTKSGRRFIQKHMPLGIAMTGPMLYKEGNGKAIDMAFDMLNTYTGKDFDSYNNLLRSLKYAKGDDERNEVWAKFWGNMSTTYNVNQAEQIIKFIDVVKSASDKEAIMDVKDNEQISKSIYKNAEGVIDNFLINGAIDAARRGIDPEQNYNRFSEESKNKFW